MMTMTRATTNNTTMAMRMTTMTTRTYSVAEMRTRRNGTTGKKVGHSKL
jgi:hypothetical protein